MVHSVIELIDLSLSNANGHHPDIVIQLDKGNDVDVVGNIRDSTTFVIGCNDDDALMFCMAAVTDAVPVLLMGCPGKQGR